MSERIEGLVHEPTQVGDDHVDLTVSDVRRVETPGDVDFGGGELAPAEFESCPRTWRNPDDDYGWWELNRGQYVLEFNESLTGSDPAVLQTRDEVRARGAFHPTLRVTTLSPVPLAVGGAGLRLKENARVSTVRAGRSGPR